MDRKKLIKRLQPFREMCAEKGKPITDMKLIEAFSGVNGMCYIVCVTVPWFKGRSLYEPIDFLVDVFFETTDVETRQTVFMIKPL